MWGTTYPAFGLPLCFDRALTPWVWPILALSTAPDGSNRIPVPHTPPRWKEASDDRFDFDRPRPTANLGRGDFDKLPLRSVFPP